MACSPVGLRAFGAEQVRFWRHEEARSHEQSWALRRARENAGIGPGAEAEAAAEWREPRRFVKADMSGTGRGPSHKTSGVGTSALP